MAKLDNITLEVDLTKFHKQVAILTECTKKLKELDGDDFPISAGIKEDNETFVANTWIAGASKNTAKIREAVGEREELIDAGELKGSGVMERLYPTIMGGGRHG